MAETAGTTEDALNEGQRSIDNTGKSGLLIADIVCRRAFQTALEGMGLSIAVLDAPIYSPEDLTQFELIVADEKEARDLRPILNVSQSSGESLRLALVAIAQRAPEQDDSAFDAFIAVPSMLSEIAARLSVVLYSHRAKIAPIRAVRFSGWRGANSAPLKSDEEAAPTL